MRDRNVAVRYAGALLTVAQSANVVESVAQSYRALAQAMEGNRNLLDFLQAPHVPERDKKDLLKRALGDQIEPLLLQFLDLMVDKYRIAHVVDTEREFARLVEESRGIQRAVVITAVPLPDDLAARLESRLAALTGKTIILEKKLDPAVIGGVSVVMGDEILDGTIRTGLALLRRQLEQAPLR